MPVIALPLLYVINLNPSTEFTFGFCSTFSNEVQRDADTIKGVRYQA